MQQVRQTLQKLADLFGADVFDQAEKFAAVHGIGLYSVGGLMNHSCKGFNVQCSFLDNYEMIVCAQDDLDPGQELLHTYFSPSIPCKTKKRLIHTKFQFECNDCEK